MTDRLTLAADYLESLEPDADPRVSMTPAQRRFQILADILEEIDSVTVGNWAEGQSISFTDAMETLSNVRVQLRSLQLTDGGHA